MAKIKNHLGEGTRNNKTGKWDIKCPDCSWKATAKDAIESLAKISNHSTEEIAKQKNAAGGL